MSHEGRSALGLADNLIFMFYVWTDLELGAWSCEPSESEIEIESVNTSDLSGPWFCKQRVQSGLLQINMCLKLESEDHLIAWTEKKTFSEKESWENILIDDARAVDVLWVLLTQIFAYWASFFSFVCSFAVPPQILNREIGAV